MTSAPNLQNKPAGAIPVYLGAAGYVHLAAAGGTLVKSGAGVLNRIVVNTGAASATLVLEDAVGAGGTIEIASISAAAPLSLDYGVTFTNGLYVTVTGTPDITITFS